jgi:hypothetical protein
VIGCVSRRAQPIATTYDDAGRTNGPDRLRQLYLAPKKRNRSKLIKFIQTAAADQLGMQRLNQNAEVTQ